MPKVARLRREPTEEWQQIEQYTLWPEQEVYEFYAPCSFGAPRQAGEGNWRSGHPLRCKASVFDRLLVYDEPLSARTCRASRRHVPSSHRDAAPAP